MATVGVQAKELARVPQSIAPGPRLERRFEPAQDADGHDGCILQGLRTRSAGGNRLPV